MNKKDREQFEINNLLKDCVDEQKAIGLSPADGIEIYIQKDPKTGYSCPFRFSGLARISLDTKRKVILIRRICFNKYSKNELKNLIHHELIHLNLKEDGEMIGHGKDWKIFSDISKKIYDTYKINPLENYTPECYKTKDSFPEYNYSSICPRCGFKSHYILEEGIEYKFNSRCPNCRKKLVHEKKTSE